jgi:outer membrane lipoprotein-sorting protein
MSLRNARSDQQILTPGEALKAIETFLNQLTTLASDFVQFSPDGLSGGEIFYKRPDKIRIQYGPPRRSVDYRAWLMG